MIKVSTRIKFESMMNILGIDRKSFDNIIFKWAEEFGFTIEEDVVIINKDLVNDFIKMLDEQFSDWNDKERTKKGEPEY
ncbi:MAG: hypothetical protein ACTSO9_16250 [Candidatus Helarchaeota archaeon]